MNYGTPVASEDSAEKLMTDSEKLLSSSTSCGSSFFNCYSGRVCKIGASLVVGAALLAGDIFLMAKSEKNAVDYIAIALLNVVTIAAVTTIIRGNAIETSPCIKNSTCCV